MAGLLVTTMAYNTGCENSEVAASVIAIGIGIGLAGMDDNDHHDRRRDDHRRDRDRGGWEGRDRRDRCRGGFCHNSVETDGDASLLQLASVNLGNESFAQKHDIPVEAGAKIQKAFANVGQSGLASFQAIGLNEKALDKIMSRELPEASAIQSMGAQLGLSPAKAQSLLQSLVSEFEQASSDSQSNYWQSCVAKGQWKTPQNAFCSNASWTGCSPETGATLCY